MCFSESIFKWKSFKRNAIMPSKRMYLSSTLTIHVKEKVCPSEVIQVTIRSTKINWAHNLI
jgi:hypothetical protein